MSYYFIILYYTILLLKYHLGPIKHLFELLVPISWCPKALTLLIFSGSMTTTDPCEMLGYFPSNSHNLALYHLLSLKILALSGVLRKQPPLPDIELVTVSRTLKACKVQAGWKIREKKKRKGNIPTFSLLSSSSPPPVDQREITSSQIPKISGLLAAGTNFVGDNFSTNQGQGIVSGWFECIAFIVHFTSIIIITSAPPQIIRHQILQVGDPALKGPPHLLALSWALLLPLSHKPIQWRGPLLIFAQDSSLYRWSQTGERVPNLVKVPSLKSTTSDTHSVLCYLHCSRWWFFILSQTKSSKPKKISLTRTDLSLDSCDTQSWIVLESKSPEFESKI